MTDRSATADADGRRPRRPHRHARHRPRRRGDGHIGDEHRRLLHALPGLYQSRPPTASIARPISAPGCSASSSIDGKMRGLFSFLFGASMLLVIQQARGRRGARRPKIHYSRMFWLLVFGLRPFISIWFGDILDALRADGHARSSSSASCPVRSLIVWAVALLLALDFVVMSASCAWQFFAVQAAAIAAPHPEPGSLAAVADAQAGFGSPDRRAAGRQDLALFRGPWDGDRPAAAVRPVAWRTRSSSSAFGVAETLAYMLFGMAGAEIGLLPRRMGGWRAIARCATGLLRVAIPAYALVRLAADPRRISPCRPFSLICFAAPMPFRPWHDGRHRRRRSSCSPARAAG